MSRTDNAAVGCSSHVIATGRETSVHRASRRPAPCCTRATQLAATWNVQLLALTLACSPLKPRTVSQAPSKWQDVKVALDSSTLTPASPPSQVKRQSFTRSVLQSDACRSSTPWKVQPEKVPAAA